MKKVYRKINDIDFESLMNHIAEDMDWARARPSMASRRDIQDNNLHQFAKVIKVETMPSQSNRSEFIDCIQKMSDDMHYTIRRGADRSRTCDEHEYFICFYQH